MNEIIWLDINKMTANNLPSPLVVSSSYQTASAYKFFDGNTASLVRLQATDVNTHAWVLLDFGVPEVINVIKVINNTNSYKPLDYRVEGSNNGTDFTKLFEITNDDVNISEHQFDNNTAYRYYRYYITRSGGWYADIAEIYYGRIKRNRNLALKNIATNKHYSLDNKTLIHLPSSSDKNMILHGIASGKEIKLDEVFDKMKYVKDTSEVLGSGKKFTHVVDVSNTKINKITL